MGTPQYISPEQARGDREIDGRTDVYAFGIILYEIVTGQVPFQSDTTYSIIHSQIFDPPPLPTEIKGDISQQLEVVLLQALQKDPADRYATAGDLFSAFKTALTDSSTALGAANNEILPDYTPVAATRPAAAGETVAEVPPLPDLTPSDVVEEPDLEEAFASAVPESAAEPAPAKRRRRTLRWIGIGLLIAVCSCVALSILGSSLDRIQQEGADAVRAAATETAAAENGAAQPPEVDDPPPDPPLDDLIRIPDNIRPTDELEALVADNPDDIQLRWELVAAYIRDDNAEEAQAIASELLAQPRRPITFHQLGERLFISGRIDVAVIVLEEGLRRFNDDRMLQRMLMTAYIFSEQPLQRVQNLVDNLQELPHDEETILMGEAYLAARDGRPEEAVAILDEIIPNADPGSLTELLYFKGRLHVTLDQPDAALESFRAALDSRPPPWLVAAIEREIEQLE